MTAKENIREIFSILHDGTITRWKGNKDKLTLAIDCLYLAERIDNSFDKFYVQLFNIDKLELDPWTNSIEIEKVIKTDFEEIFKAELDILSAVINDDAVIVSCQQYNRDFDYSGGNLKINCEKIKVFDQNKNELTIKQFGEICKSYWDEFRKK